MEEEPLSEGIKLENEEDSSSDGIKPQHEEDSSGKGLKQQCDEGLPGGGVKQQDEVGDTTKEDIKSTEKKDEKLSLKELKKKGRAERAARRNEENLSRQMQQMGLGVVKPPGSISGTGIIYDEKMLNHSCVYGSEPGISENPERISGCYDKLQQYGLFEECQHIPARQATDTELEMLHCPKYIELMKKTVDMSVDELKTLAETYDSVCLNPNTFETAIIAAGGTLSLIEAIVEKKVRNGIGIVRPPGHHAQYNIACGYGYFNNISLAAHHARHNLNIDRVLIIDWDTHHGQGTQYFFEEDPSVLYFSIHRYENATFWPSLTDSNYDQIGKGKGKGFNVNIPWNKINMGDSEYIAVFQHILLPIAYQFDPQLVLVSAGYDAGIGDPKGENSVTPVGFAHLTSMLMPLAEGKLALILEGGYNSATLTESVAMCTSVLLGRPCPALQTNKPRQSAIQTIVDVIRELQPYWQCLQYQGNPEFKESVSEEDTEGENTGEDKLTINTCRVLADMKVHTQPHRTALVYDERMRKHRNQFNKSHPERPDRITRIFEQHKDWHLVERCLRVEARMATDDEILQLHSEKVLEMMKAAQEMEEEELFRFSMNFNSIFFHQSAYESASLAVGSVLNVVQKVASGEVRNGACIVRPPGHHAEANVPCGFCFFNTVALAAKYAQNNCGLQRILIVDWDVHHGNGIQHMFEDDDSVLYISLHRYDHGTFYPGSPDANYDRVGKGKGKGYNVNISWNGDKMGDAEYITAFLKIVMPIAREFSPELVLVSSGFDAAKGDPLGGYRITPEGYAHLTHMLSSLAEGKVVIVLEGGYNLNSISLSMAMCTRTLLGDTCPRLETLLPCDAAWKTICNVVRVQSQYWKSLQFPVAEKVKVVSPEEGGVRKEITVGDTDTFVDDKPEGVTAKQTIQHRVCEDGDNLNTANVDTLTEGVKSLTVEESTVHSADTVKQSDEQKTDVGPGIDETATSATAQSTDSKIKTTLCSEPTEEENPDEMQAAALSTDFGDEATYFTVIPLPWCPHLKSVQDVPSDGIDTSASCVQCHDVRENWVCLTCYKVFCGRFIHEHMVEHSTTSDHPLTLSYSDISVWCYLCDSYIHNEILAPAKTAAYRHKFGEDPPCVV
ncbi:protein deacetylase HDAC6-like [Glandiceps talaboti]